MAAPKLAVDIGLRATVSSKSFRLVIRYGNTTVRKRNGKKADAEQAVAVFYSAPFR